MWQAPNHRTRAAGKKRSDSLANALHIKRVHAELRVVGDKSSEPKITMVRVILNDLSLQGVNLFSTEPHIAGAEVAITMEDPMQIYLRGRIVACQEYAIDSHIMSVNNFSYRLSVKFVFETEREQKAVQDFVDFIAMKVTNTQKAA